MKGKEEMEERNKKERKQSDARNSADVGYPPFADDVCILSRCDRLELRVGPSLETGQNRF